jgi:hypothetical protein
VIHRTNRWRRRSVSLPSVLFALFFIVLGWITSHSIAYTLVGFMPHDHREWHIHGYLDVLKLTGGCGLVLVFGLALRTFLRHGSFGEWLHEGGVAGTRKQVVLATALPAGVFVLIEHLERLVAGTGTSPSFQLLAVGILVQVVVGLLCLALVRLTFRVTERFIDSIIRSLLTRPGRQAHVLYLESVIHSRSAHPIAVSGASRAPPVTTVFS